MFPGQLLRVVFSTFGGQIFNPECNTERGFIDSLSIALGEHPCFHAPAFLQDFLK